MKAFFYLEEYIYIIYRIIPLTIFHLLQAPILPGPLREKMIRSRLITHLSIIQVGIPRLYRTVKGHLIKGHHRQRPFYCDKVTIFPRLLSTDGICTITVPFDLRLSGLLPADPLQGKVMRTLPQFTLVLCIATMCQA